MRVTQLSTTPIKGLALHHPSAIRVDETGAVGDRVFFLVDEGDALVSGAKTGALVGISAEYDATTRRLSLYEHGDLLVRDEVHLGDDPGPGSDFGDGRDRGGGEPL